ncbi:MAG: translation initiation factor IF-6 [Desulfurococcaceae archaeon]|jgi:translation initiation factor 6|nr:translation initiation factor IF-6 [Desulfurococcaceae archaeon]
MTLEKIRIFGNPNIGVYIFANNKIALIPPINDADVKRKIASNLNVDVIECKIAGTNLIGVLVAGNDNCLLLPRIVRDKEVEELKDLGINVNILYTNFTALGNVILANNKKAIVHPELHDRDVEVVKKVLRVDEVIRRPIGKFVTVGSVAVINDVGGLVHPDVSDEELQELSKILGIQLDVGTVNFGVAFIKTGLVANNYGAVVGERTTGPEIMRIIKALNIGGS